MIVRLRCAAGKRPHILEQARGDRGRGLTGECARVSQQSVVAVSIPPAD